jgi:hypothetical protein
MGLGYQKKMKELGDKAQIADLLESNGISSEDDLNFLLDLKNKNPEAIKKLILDSGIDPLDIDTDEDSTYVPNDYEGVKTNPELKQITDTLMESPEGQKTIDLFANNWDSKSHDLAVEHPGLLLDIETHKKSGAFNTIQTAVEYEKSLGNIPSNLSDVEAYMMIGLKLEKEGLFDPSPSDKQKPSTQKNNTSKKAASIRPGSRSKNPSVSDSDIDMNKMTDDEVSKFLEELDL